jgi:hypothetical protein
MVKQVSESMSLTRSVAADEERITLTTRGNMNKRPGDQIAYISVAVQI